MTESDSVLSRGWIITVASVVWGYVASVSFFNLSVVAVVIAVLITAIT